MEQLYQLLSKEIRIPSSLESDIIQNAELIELKKNELLLEAGTVCRHTYFILSGTLRTFHYTDDKDITSWFYSEGIVTSWSSYVNETASKEYIQSTEKSTVLAVSKQNMEILFDKYPELERFSRRSLEKSIAYMEDFYRGFMFMTAEERYQLLNQEVPNISQRVNLGHIASFLGITQETLSRIRKSIHL